MNEPTFVGKRLKAPFPLGLLGVAVLLGVPVVSVMLSQGSNGLLLAWIFTLLAFAVFMFVCGHGVTGRWLGVLIDDRNLMSLSRFQIVLWTALVLSGYLVAVLHNILSGQLNPLGVSIPREVWWLMGISTTSLVGSPLLLNTKTSNVADDSEVKRTFALLEKQDSNDNKLDAKGQIVVNTDISKARWSDLFTGEEVGNAAHLDVARLQMFFFTLIAALGYAVFLGHMFSIGGGAVRFPQLPGLDQSMLALIAISHTGYLAAKAVSHSQTGSEPAVKQEAPAAADLYPPMG